ncbi:MAG TPA: hypothetical protein DCY88_25095 [Cyanobacteria bacterium UBA11372]|nr:hypothetical protein [Cyanobacteria bacterium UBA11372]
MVLEAIATSGWMRSPNWVRRDRMTKFILLYRCDATQTSAPSSVFPEKYLESQYRFQLLKAVRVITNYQLPITNYQLSIFVSKPPK